MKYEVQMWVAVSDPPHRYSYLTIYSGNSFWRTVFETLRVKNTRPRKPVRVVWR
jgi:hypothetical protein